MESTKLKKIREGIKKYPDLSASKLLLKLKEEGLKIRRQDFLNEYKNIKGINIVKDTSKNVPTAIRFKQLVKEGKSEGQIKSIFDNEHRRFDDKQIDKAFKYGKKGNFKKVKRFVKKQERKRKRKNIRFLHRRVSQINSNRYGVIELINDIDSYDDGSPLKKHSTKILSFGLRGIGDIKKFNKLVIRAYKEGNIKEVYYLDYFSNRGQKTTIDIKNITNQTRIEEFMNNEVDTSIYKINEVNAFKELKDIRGGVEETDEEGK